VACPSVRLIKLQISESHKVIVMTSLSISWALGHISKAMRANLMAWFCVSPFKKQLQCYFAAASERDLAEQGDVATQDGIARQGGNAEMEGVEIILEQHENLGASGQENTQTAINSTLPATAEETEVAFMT
jgi:hypothetical protein